jgi:uncharacterized heparinase superfamily protein
MQLGRLWRTVRHLTPEQFLWRGICRGRRVVMRFDAGRVRRRIEQAAQAMPLPDAGSATLHAIAGHVLALQQAVHNAHLDGIAAGRFVLLNREYDFGGIDRVDWRGSFDEGNNPLRRMTLAYMGWAVPLLARGTAEGLDTVTRLLASLEAQNPFTTGGVFRDVWNAYTASHRLINLLAGLALHRAAGGAPSAGDERAILDHARFCAAFVRANLERDLQYNHLMKNYVALSVYAAALDHVPPSLVMLRDAVPRAIAQNVLADGGHAERSPMYHALAMVDVELLRASGLFDGAWNALLDDAAARMTSALAVMSHPDGDIALFNDAWLGEAPPASALTGGTPPPSTARLPVTGYVRIGDGGEAAILDCGPCGPDDNPGHAHADFLSVELSVGGRRLIVDPGVPTYTAGTLRDMSRSAASHNAPSIEGVEPIEFWKSFRVGRRGRAAEITDARLAGVAPLWCAGHHTGYAHVGLQMRRWLGLWPGAGLLVCDVCIGRQRQLETIRFLVDGAWAARAAQAGTQFAQAGQTVRARALIGRMTVPRAGRFWPRFGVEMPAHEFALFPEDTGRYRRAALWLGWGDVEPPGRSVVVGLLDRLAGF